MNQQNRNRVADYYETAVTFLSLPINSRYLVGVHFKILRSGLLILGNKETMDEEIFREVFKRDIYEEFKTITRTFKASRSHEYPLKH